MILAHLTREQRTDRKMAPCLPHLGRNFRLGDARRRRPYVKYFFAEEEDSWKYKRTPNLEIDEVMTRLRSMWRLADAEDLEEASEMDSARALEKPERASIRAGMQACLRQWKVTCRELHTATLAAGLPVPARPSRLNKLENECKSYRWRCRCSVPTQLRRKSFHRCAFLNCFAH